MTAEVPEKPRKRSRLGCLGCASIFILSCCAIGGLGLFAGSLLRSLRPSAREVYSGAPDLQAGEDVSKALIESGVEGASVLVIPIKGTSGQIAIITLDESKGFTGFSGGSADSLQIVVKNIVEANRQGDYQIERLSIDYRDSTGKSSLAFTATMQAAEDYADGAISRQQFMGNVDFNLMDSLRYFGLDQALKEVQQP